MRNLQTKLNLIETHQSIVSEEIYQSLHCRDVKMNEKDSNNNTATSITTTTITTLPSTKVKSKIDKTTMIQKPIDIKNSASKAENNSKSFENTSLLSSQLQSGTNTLKRKRETKSPTKQQAADSTTYESSKKQQQEQQQLLSPTVATILVSTKTKTKSGLPLLLKK